MTRLGEDDSVCASRRYRVQLCIIFRTACRVAVVHESRIKDGRSALLIFAIKVKTI